MHKGEDLNRKVLSVMMRHLHCIAEIRAHWVETKSFEIDNPRHHYQIAWQCRLCLYSRGGKIF